MNQDDEIKALRELCQQLEKENEALKLKLDALDKALYRFSAYKRVSTILGASTGLGERND